MHLPPSLQTTYMAGRCARRLATEREVGESSVRERAPGQKEGEGTRTRKYHHQVLHTATVPARWVAMFHQLTTAPTVRFQPGLSGTENKLQNNKGHSVSTSQRVPGFSFPCLFRCRTAHRKTPSRTRSSSSHSRRRIGTMLTPAWLCLLLWFIC